MERKSHPKTGAIIRELMLFDSDIAVDLFFKRLDRMSDAVRRQTAPALKAVRVKSYAVKIVREALGGLETVETLPPLDIAKDKVGRLLSDGRADGRADKELRRATLRFLTLLYRVDLNDHTSQ